MRQTVWISLPVAAVILGLGVWGVNEHNAKAAMVAELNSRYAHSFNELTAHATDLHEEIGKARVSNNSTLWQERLQSISRMSSLAQDEIGKLPLNIMPMHETQTVLATITDQVDGWLKTGAKPTSTGVQNGLDKMWRESGTVETQTTALQTKALTGNANWVQAESTVRTGKGDNQIVNGFRKLDKAMGAFVETRVPTNIAASAATSPTGAVTTPLESRNTVKKFFSGHHVQIKSVNKIMDSTINAEVYRVKGSVDGENMESIVSTRGNHLLWYVIDRTLKDSSYDFGSAADAAAAFVHHHGFSHIVETDAYQLGRIGYFTFSPEVNGATVVNQSIEVKMALDRASLPLGVNFLQVYTHPLGTISSRKFTPASLKHSINPKDHIEMEQKTIVEDRSHKYQPCVSFYVTRDGETYRVDMNAHNGREIDTVDLRTR